MTYRVELADGSRLQEWQTFVDSQPHAHALHHSGWFQVLAESSGVKPRFLIARSEDGAIAGVMPAYLSRSAASGAHVTTLDAGVLAAHPGAAAKLVEHAREALVADRARYFMLRGAAAETEGLQDERNEYVVTIVDTKRTTEQIWGGFKKKTRWYVRQGQKQNFSVHVDPGLANIEVFYSLYARHVHRLGTPVMGKEMMQAMIRYLGPRLRLLLIERSNEIVGGMLIVVGNRGFLDLYALVRHDLRDTAAGYLLYWEALALASDEGASELNLGRSTVGSGTHLFKVKWGGRDEPLIYRYYPAPGTGRVGGLEKYQGGHTLMQHLWKRLPLWMANKIGPRLRRQLPFG